MSFFQIAPMTKVSTQIHSSMCQYDVYKVSKKKNEWKGSVRGVKVNFFFGGVSLREEEGTRFKVSRKGKEKRRDLAKAGNCELMIFRIYSELQM